jgi:hypothetical protein
MSTRGNSAGSCDIGGSLLPALIRHADGAPPPNGRPGHSSRRQQRRTYPSVQVPAPSTCNVYTSNQTRTYGWSPEAPAAGRRRARTAITPARGHGRVGLPAGRMIPAFTGSLTYCSPARSLDAIDPLPLDVAGRQGPDGGDGIHVELTRLTGRGPVPVPVLVRHRLHVSAASAPCAERARVRDAPGRRAFR